MNESNVTLVAFVVRIHIEIPHDQPGAPRWYGHIACVQSGKHSYFKKLRAIERFILPFLHEAGVKTSLWARLWHRLR